MRPAGFHQGVEFSGMTYNSGIGEILFRFWYSSIHPLVRSLSEASADL